MNIHNIQIAPSLFRAVEERFSDKKKDVSSQNDASVPRMSVPDEQDQKVEDRKAYSGEKDLMQIIYPPFFPIGETQSIHSIEVVKLNGGDEKSAASVTRKEQRAIQQKEIDNNRAKNSVNNAIQQSITHSPDVLMNAQPTSVKSEDNSGVVVDLTV